MSEGIQVPETRAKAAEQRADRYMALWNEPDGERRRRLIAELWTEDGSQIPQPPQEMREIAASPGNEHWVGSEGLSFRARDDARRLNVLVLAADGRVQRNYTFVDGA